MLLEHSLVGGFPCLGLRDRRLWAVGDAGELAGQAFGQGGVDLAMRWVPSCLVSLRTKGL